MALPIASTRNVTELPAQSFNYTPQNTNLPDENYALGAANQNLGAVSQNTELAAIINAVNQAAQQKLNESRLGPAGVSARDQMLENINRSAQGYLGEDYVRQQQNKFAGMGVGAGFGADSPYWNAALERALGLETKKIQDESIGQLSDLYEQNPAAKLYGMEEGNISPDSYAQSQNQKAELYAKNAEYAQNLALEYRKLAEETAYRTAQLGESRAAREEAADLARQTLYATHPGAKPLRQQIQERELLQSRIDEENRSRGFG